MSIESQESMAYVDVSNQFSSLDAADFADFLRAQIKENPTTKFQIVTNWVNKMTARKAKAFFDNSRFNIASIIIKATREQYEEDVNAFESGVQWEELK